MALGSWFNLLATGDKPDQLTPNFKDLTTIQRDTVAGNLSILPEAEKLASGVDTFRQNEMVSMLRKQIPGYDAIQDQIGKNIAAGVAGELKPGTVNTLKRVTAEGAQRGGYAGSQVADFAAAENIGKFSEQLADESANSFERWTQSTRVNTVPQLFDFSNLFLNSAQRVGVEDQRAGLNFQAAMRNAAIEAAPDPFMAALASDAGATVNSLASAAAFGLGAGGGGGASSSLGAGASGGFGGSLGSAGSMAEAQAAMFAQAQGKSGGGGGL